MPVNPDNLNKAIEAARKAYGASVIRSGDFDEPVGRISTGSLELDIATNGGIPMGRWSHFYGGFMSAKTLTGWNVIANAQKLMQTCAYYNMEKQYDKVWVDKRGINSKLLQVIETTKIEEVGTIMEVLMPSVHLHVLDSLAAAISVDELAGELTDWNVGLAARAWGKVLRRVNERFDATDNTVIMINQVRDVFGARGGGEAPPGGRFIEFMSSLSLHFKRSSWLFRDKAGILTPKGESENTLSGDTVPAGIEFQVRVIKSRVGPPLRTARIRLDFETGLYDDVWTLFKAAKHYGLVEVNKSWYTLPSGDKVQGENGVREYIMENPKYADQIKTTMMDSVK